MDFPFHLFGAEGIKLQFLFQEIQNELMKYKVGSWNDDDVKMKEKNDDHFH